MGSSEQDQTEATAKECRDAVSRVLVSDRFAQADRLKNFLTYIVDETLAGRGDLIRGKTIAMDIYGRDPATSGLSENVVRVDARRLRRSLAEYYSTQGKDEPVRIWVDRGGYVPRMVIRNTETAKGPMFGARKILAAAAIVALLVAGLGATLAFGFRRPSSAPEQNSQIVLERQALRDKSAATLQAANLAEQARGFLFPLLEPERQIIATDMFRQVIRLDPDYFGGYAGAAQTLTTLSKLKPPGPDRDETLAEALRMAELATQMNPTDTWTQAAAGWAAFGNGEFARAYGLSSRAAELAPEDGYILDFHALISALTEHFEAARQASDPTRARSFANRRFANRNLFGVASFHLSDYSEAIASFQKAAELGDPISAPSLMYQAAAHQALGNTKRAGELVQELTSTWPGFRPDVALAALFQHHKHVEQVLDQLRAAGWQPAR